MKQKTKKILKNLNDAGQCNSISWRRTLKTLKDFPGLVEKQTTAIVKAGIDYANLSSVKTAITNGERGEVESLPWGEWLDFPRVIGHTNKAHEYNEYIRLYPLSPAQLEHFPAMRPSVQYFINGKMATAEECKPLCLASEFRDDSRELTCFTINADNILSVGGVAV